MKFRTIALASSLLMLSSAASASLMVDVSNIDITSNGGNFLKWNTTELGDFSFNLDGTSTQAYGTFKTKDFPFGLVDLFDTDPLNVSLTLTPPGSNAAGNGTVDAHGVWLQPSTDYLTIDFNNDWISMGAYDVSFQDLKITKDGTYNLLADFREVAAAVPEPSILALFGAGLLGIGFVRRRKA